jgi:hypothetical protein
MAQYKGVNEIKVDKEYKSISSEDRHLVEIAEDIEMQGQTVPIVINSDDEIVDGRYRLKAIKEVLNRSKIRYVIKDVKGDYKKLASLSANIFAQRYNDWELTQVILEMEKLIEKLYPGHSMFKPGPKGQSEYPDIERPIVQVAGARGKTVRSYEDRKRILQLLDPVIAEVVVKTDIKLSTAKEIANWPSKEQEALSKKLEKEIHTEDISDELESGALRALRSSSKDSWQYIHPRQASIETPEPIIAIGISESPVCLSDLGLFGHRIKRMSQMSRENITWDSIYVGYLPKTREYVFVKYLSFYDGLLLSQAQFAHWNKLGEIVKHTKGLRGFHTFSIENNDKESGKIIWDGIAIPKFREQQAILAKKKA